MPNREVETTVAGRNESGAEIAARVRQRVSDAPLLPVAEMERLAQFLPDANRVIIEQTVKEAEFRRTETLRENARVARERLVGQIFGFLIGLSSVIAGAVVAVNGYSVAGGTIATVAVGTLAVAFLAARGEATK